MIKILLFFLALLSISCAGQKAVKIGPQDQIIFTIPSKNLKAECDYERENKNYACGLVSGEQSWIFRRAVDKQKADDFLKKSKAILAESEFISILAYDSYFGALKGTNKCWEWFLDDCKKL